MAGRLMAAAVAACFCIAMQSGQALAQKAGGILRVYNRDSPPSMSILEESALSTVLPMMGVFNNLVVYDQHVAQNSKVSIVPDLATGWSWSEDGTRLSFELRQGVKWHDGEPFTAQDVKCTWDLLTGKASNKLRINPRRSWYSSLEEVVTKGDGIEYTIIPNRSTALLAFESGKFDMTWPYDVPVPVLKDVQSQSPQAICETAPLNANRNLIINPQVPPFDDPEIRRAMALALDRKAFIDILDRGQGDIGGAMLPPPAGVWGLPPEMLKGLPGYDPDVENSRAEARAVMEKAGYGPDHRLSVKLTVRNIPITRDPAIILIDQLKTIYIDAELEPIETVNWFRRAMRKEYAIGLNMTAGAIDDPDQQLFENYSCSSERNITGYCNPELEKELAQQSMEPDPEKRKELVRTIDRKLQEDGARPIIFYYRAASCWQPYVQGLTIMVNSIYNGWRFEDLWLDR